MWVPFADSNRLNPEFNKSDKFIPKYNPLFKLKVNKPLKNETIIITNISEKKNTPRHIYGLIKSFVDNHQLTSDVADMEE